MEEKGYLTERSVSKQESRRLSSKSHFLNNLNSIPVDDPEIYLKLTEEEVEKRMKRLEALKLQLNKITYGIKKLEVKKSQLQEHYSSMQKSNADVDKPSTESYLNRINNDIEQIEEKIAYEEIQERAYTHMRNRERTVRIWLKKAIDDAKAQLSKTDELNVESNKLDTNSDEKKNESNATDQLDLQRTIDQVKKKIANGNKTLEYYESEIENSKNRILLQENLILYNQHKSDRIKRIISQYKNSREYSLQLIHKFTQYQNEYKRQYQKLQFSLKVEHREELRQRREENEIQAQTELNEQYDRMSKLKTMSKFYWTLSQELIELQMKVNKNNTLLQKRRMYDKGEYNKSTLSNKYIENTKSIQLYYHHDEEKKDILRKVISGIKHILFTLQI